MIEDLRVANRDSALYFSEMRSKLPIAEGSGRVRDDDETAGCR